MKSLLLISFLTPTIFALPNAPVKDVWHKRQDGSYTPDDCNDFGENNRKYMSEKIAFESADDFCEQAGKQRLRDPVPWEGKMRDGIYRTLNGGTPEEVEFIIKWDQKEIFMANGDICKEVMRAITVKCDAKGNQDNWRAGGYLKNGPATYMWHLVKERPRKFTLGMQVTGSCLKSDHTNESGVVVDTKYVVTGAGFLAHNNAYNIKNRLNNRWEIEDVRDWNFGYMEGADDEKEWKVEFTLDGYAESHVEEVLSEVSDGQLKIKCRDGVF
ncbi:hypothetical protein M011DRAFT_481792 [Sporormia fimetaria CBS 119925]|uniref:C-type lectin domain-containing protein n=1 Tax=Sporormia fimetaria CBS 119925 TaxID=1340428 RepID=A0A6A6UVL5_9PLEO|nr:hypothetical protein M011DRAFT_481792 [Sporormia fimetaria CBS 119925]